MAALALGACNAEIGASGVPGSPRAQSSADVRDLGSIEPLDLGEPEAPIDLGDPQEDLGSEAPVDMGTAVDLGQPDLGPPDSGVEPERVPVWIAQGHVGRTIMSCDDGRTWIQDRAFDAEGDVDACGEVQANRCFDPNGGTCRFLDGESCRTSSGCDCDHSPGAGRGIAYGGGWFVATWGWGPVGGIRISRDGRSWTKVVDDTVFAGLQYVGGRFVTGSRDPMVADDPRSWRQGGSAELVTNDGRRIWNPRTLFGLDHGSGLVLLTGESGSAHGLMVSDDFGDSWWTPNEMPTGCGARSVGAAAGDGVIIWVGRELVCRSTDGGRSFEAGASDLDARAGPIWDGREFKLWRRGTAFRSPDGITWTSVPLTGPDLGTGGAGDFSVVGRSPVTGNYVAVNGGWQQWYEDQRFYRSENGIDWERLDGSDTVGSHPIQELSFGWVDATADCPAP